MKKVMWQLEKFGKLLSKIPSWLPKFVVPPSGDFGRSFEWRLSTPRNAEAGRIQ